MNSVPILPEEFKGTVRAKDKYHKTAPRLWTKEELNFMQDLIKQGYDVDSICESLGRSKNSVKLKLKRLTKKDGTYNHKHYKEKMRANKRFLDYISPHSVLDVYNGGNTQYNKYDVITNDINREVDTLYHMDALKLLYYLYIEDKRFDYIDLDPFGRPYPCIDVAMKLLQDEGGLCITFGEYGHKRWKRLDYVERFYDITELSMFTSKAFLREVERIAHKNKKQSSFFDVFEWENILRVYVKLYPLKITKQWEKNKKKRT